MSIEGRSRLTVSPSRVQSKMTVSLGAGRSFFIAKDLKKQTGKCDEERQQDKKPFISNHIAPPPLQEHSVEKREMTANRVKAAPTKV